MRATSGQNCSRTFLPDRGGEGRYSAARPKAAGRVSIITTPRLDERNAAKLSREVSKSDAGPAPRRRARRRIDAAERRCSTTLFDNHADDYWLSNRSAAFFKTCRKLSWVVALRVAPAPFPNAYSSAKYSPICFLLGELLVCRAAFIAVLVSDDRSPSSLFPVSEIKTSAAPLKFLIRIELITGIASPGQ
jgi:hypothetical protein